MEYPLRKPCEPGSGSGRAKTATAEMICVGSRRHDSQSKREWTSSRHFRSGTSGWRSRISRKILRRFAHAANGGCGLETSLGLTLGPWLHRSLIRRVAPGEMMFAQPGRRCQKLRRGHARVGAIADDTTVIDRLSTWTVRGKVFVKSRNTPFDGDAGQGQDSSHDVGGEIGKVLRRRKETILDEPQARSKLALATVGFSAGAVARAARTVGV